MTQARHEYQKCALPVSSKLRVTVRSLVGLLACRHLKLASPKLEN